MAFHPKLLRNEPLVDARLAQVLEPGDYTIERQKQKELSDAARDGVPPG